MGPQDFAFAYDVGTLELPGSSGVGATVGVVARSDFAMADVDAFRVRFLPTASGRVRKRFVASNPGIIPSDGNIEEQEVLLDTQWAGAVAPGANIETAIGSKHGGIMESLQSLIEANAADVLSLSFALCEAETPRGYAGWVDALYALASAQGQTVVVAAGDSGDRECVRGRSEGCERCGIKRVRPQPTFDPCACDQDRYAGSNKSNDEKLG